MKSNTNHTPVSDRPVSGWRPLALAAVGMVALAGSVEAQNIEQPGRVGATSDSSRISHPLHFRKSVLFTPDHLSRLAEKALESRLASSDAAGVGGSDGRHASYATRYNISRELAQKIYDVAIAEGIDPELAFRLVRVESRFDTRARGPAGALGLAQLMPSTARALDRTLRTEAQILDPATNLRLGFSYLRRLIDRYDGDVRLGLLAYNRGEGAVDRALRSGRDPENGYSRKVLGTRGANAYTGRGVVPKSR